MVGREHGRGGPQVGRTGSQGDLGGVWVCVLGIQVKGTWLCARELVCVPVGAHARRTIMGRAVCTGGRETQDRGAVSVS